MKMKMYQFKYMLITIIGLFCIVSFQEAELDNNPSANKTVKILTIGNSFANNACTYLSQITESVPGYEIVIAKANIGGCSLERHVSLIKECDENPALKPYSNEFSLKDLLEMDEYDFITIQQVSSLSFIKASYQPYAEILYAFIKEHAPGSEIIIHQTWAYSPTCKRLNEWGISREEMHQRLVKNYSDLAEQLNLDVLPSGNAFYRSFQTNPEIDLWANDGYHASLNGNYLAGCVWFGKFFGVSPVKINYIPEGMHPDVAKHLRNVAAKETEKQAIHTLQ